MLDGLRAGGPSRRPPDRRAPRGPRRGRRGGPGPLGGPHPRPRPALAARGAADRLGRGRPRGPARGGLGRLPAADGRLCPARARPRRRRPPTGCRATPDARCASTLRQLEYLVAVGEAGSVAQAAARLHVSAPSISTAISQLEAELGLRLFVRRHAQALSLTPGGLGSSRPPATPCEGPTALLPLAADLGAALSGPLAIGCLSSFAALVLPGSAPASRPPSRGSPPAARGRPRPPDGRLRDGRSTSASPTT